MKNALIRIRTKGASMIDYILTSLILWWCIALCRVVSMIGWTTIHFHSVFVSFKLCGTMECHYLMLKLQLIFNWNGPMYSNMKYNKRWLVNHSLNLGGGKNYATSHCGYISFSFIILLNIYFEVKKLASLSVYCAVPHGDWACASLPYQ